MSGSGGSRSETYDDGSTVASRQPDHLVVWLKGHVASTDDQILDDGRLGDRFRLPGWMDEVRAGYPESIAGATFPPHLMGQDGHAVRRAGEEWLDLTRVAAGIDHRGDERSFTGDTTPTSLSALRRWAMRRLDMSGFDVDDVVLSLSELSTNVERHGGDWLTVDLVDRGSLAVLAVTDPASDRLPVPREAGPDEATGRGLLVVASLALRWGVVVRSTHKTVWAVFPRSR